jgi:hypothetical protein
LEVMTLFSCCAFRVNHFVYMPTTKQFCSFSFSATQVSLHLSLCLKTVLNNQCLVPSCFRKWFIFPVALLPSPVFVILDVVPSEDSKLRIEGSSSDPYSLLQPPALDMHCSRLGLLFLVILSYLL